MAPGASPAVEPVVGEPAAVADLGDRRLLLVADVHAGIEVGLRYERGVELDSRADERRERLCGLIAETDADRLVILGDLAHRIAAPEGDEREELVELIRAVTDRVPMTLVEGNHDAGVAEAFADDLDVIGAGGAYSAATAASATTTQPQVPALASSTAIRGRTRNCSTPTWSVWDTSIRKCDWKMRSAAREWSARGSGANSIRRRS